jgi:hypothetical protein
LFDFFSLQYKEPSLTLCVCVLCLCGGVLCRVLCRCGSGSVGVSEGVCSHDGAVLRLKLEGARVDHVRREQCSTRLCRRRSRLVTTCGTTFYAEGKGTIGKTRERQRQRERERERERDKRYHSALFLLSHVY